MNIEQLVKASVLLDFYGGILTENQRRIAKSYLDYNASLSEIAENLGTTRQAVSDVLHRTLKRLNEVESKLRLYAKYQRILNEIPKVAEQVSSKSTLIISEEYTKLFKTLEDDYGNV